ncbi:MAG: HAD hydrolase-like protein, partial [Proteobacteria bacterium]|nr:HAD hydrolase-like protein [Pseudomonadota bacterium]
MPKGVLFDLDGTLLDSAPDFIVSLNTLLQKYNRPELDPEIIR